MGLTEYKKKRDFKKTSEPTGAKKTRKRALTPLMFVVQEHHASHLHYDFRLEWEGVLKSWAVPKGPSLDPKIKRLAVEVEDHPLEYGHFEGIIPEKQYGAGKVYIWDTGTWIPQGDVSAGLKKGHIDFELKGKKLKGSWTLIRTRTQGRSPQWLLMKRSDKYVKEGDVVKPKSEKARPRKSAGAQIPYVEPELALLVDDPPTGNNWLHETKFDGYRMQAHLTGPEVKLLSRRGLDWSNKFPTVTAALHKMSSYGTVLDGEIVWLEKSGRSDFQMLQNSIKSHDQGSIYYYVFDAPFIEGQDLRHETLLARKKALKKYLSQHHTRNSIVRYSDHIQGDAKSLFKEACRLNLEGLVSKRADSPYLSGRNPNWQKSKCGMQQEFVIGGFTEGQGARQGFGALLLGVYEGKKLRYVGKVGTGFTETSLREVRKVLKGIEQEECPFDIAAPRGRGIHWVSPTRSAEITFANWTQDKHLRVPVFHGLREDKKAKDIVMETPASRRHMRSATVTKSRSSHAKDSSLPLTNPDKILFAKEKITKKDVAEFYVEIAKFMLPGLANRPLALLRCPEGTSKSCFFQKHANGKVPSHISEVNIQEKTENRPYMTVSSTEGLVALVQMGAFEIHCWNCKKDRIEYPDQIVMDFDPGPGVPWKTVVDAAFELKGILEALRLKSYVKLSGGKGLHVHVPFQPIYSWDEVKAFSKVLADEMESRNPELYVSKMTKSLRKGRIFVDYLRNSRGSTAVAPYCLRARAVSAVAMPISWNELKKIPSPDYFDIDKARLHLRKRRKDPWEDYYKNLPIIGLLGKKKRKRPSTASQEMSL